MRLEMASNNRAAPECSNTANCVTKVICVQGYLCPVSATVSLKIQ